MLVTLRLLSCDHPLNAQLILATHRGQFYDNYLKFIILNTKPVSWQSMDLSRLLKRNYDDHFLDGVYENSVEISFSDYKSKVQNVKTAPEPYSNRIVPLLITYTDKNSFVTMARHFGIMDDPKVTSLAFTPSLAFLLNLTKTER